MENKWLAGIHYLKQQVSHVSLFGTAFLLLLRLDDLFSQVALAFAHHYRIITVHAEISDNVLFPQFVIQIHQRDNPCFDKHQQRKAQGDPLFSGNFQKAVAV